MKRILYTILLMLVAGVTFAQSYPRKCTEEDIPSSERKKYFEQVENSMQNYYMLLLDLTDQEMREDFISQIFMDNSNKHIPEFYLSEKKNQRLSPGQYLIELDKVTSVFDRDELEFQIDNFHHQPDMYMINMRSCYTISEYDLTLTNNGKVVFKRRCRITSLFPKASSYIRVKTMQVEPVRDIIAYKKPETQTVVADNNQITDMVHVSGVITEESSLDDNIVITDNTKKVKNEKSDSIMALQGDSRVQLDLGIKYYKEKNYNTSLNWLKKAYTQGEPEAAFYMAQCYYYNKPANYDAAKLFYQDAISKDIHVLESNYSLAWMAEYGQGQDEDIEEAIALYKKCVSYHDSKDRLSKLEASYNNGYEYVDLGLSVKWATCNLGASSPEKVGDRFAWGETDRKSYFEKGNSRNYKRSFKLSINGTYLDAARMNMSGKWQMPTATQFKELIDKCKWEETYYKGTKGYTVTGPNGNHIFLPGENYTSYWTANPDKIKKTSFRAFLSKTLKTTLSCERYKGFYIRPVIK